MDRIPVIVPPRPMLEHTRAKKRPARFLRWAIALGLVSCLAVIAHSLYRYHAKLKGDLEQSSSQVAELCKTLEAKDEQHTHKLDAALELHIHSSSYLPQDPASRRDHLERGVGVFATLSDAKGKLGSLISEIQVAPAIPSQVTFQAELHSLSPKYCEVRLIPSDGIELHRSQFRLSQGSRPLHHVTLSEVGEGETKARFVYVLVDQSASTKNVMPEIKSGLAEFIRRLTTVSTVKLSTFSNKLQPLTPWTMNGDDAARAVEQIVPDGGTALKDSLIAAMNELRLMQGEKTLILLSDGRDSTEGVRFDEVKAIASESRIRIVSIAINTPQDHTELLKELAEDSNGKSYSLNNIADLSRQLASIEKSFTERGYRFIILDPIDQSAPITIEANSGFKAVLKLRPRD
jgi:Mg-chelatase subunit ChlD